MPDYLTWCEQMRHLPLALPGAKLQSANEVKVVTLNSKVGAKLRFDKYFYSQRNRDDSNVIIPLDDFENCRMKGVAKYPITRGEGIEAVEIDYHTLNPLLIPTNKIALRLILSESCMFIKKDLSYYMRFLFYDFDRMIYLFLFNAKMLKMSYVPLINRKGNLVLSIVSNRCDEIPAYKIIEIEHRELM